MAQTIFEALEGERRLCRGKRLFRTAPPPAAPSQRWAQGARRPRGGGRRGRNSRGWRGAGGNSRGSLGLAVGWGRRDRTAPERRLSGGAGLGTGTAGQRKPWEGAPGPEQPGKAGPAGMKASDRNSTSWLRGRDGFPGGNSREGWGRPGREPQGREAACGGPWFGSL